MQVDQPVRTEGRSPTRRRHAGTAGTAVFFAGLCTLLVPLGMRAGLAARRVLDQREMLIQGWFSVHATGLVYGSAASARNPCRARCYPSLATWLRRRAG